MLRTRSVLCLAALATLALGACGSDDDDSGSPAASTPAAADTTPAAAETTVAAAGATLSISGLSFGNLTATAGETITVVNDDAFGHTVTDRGGAFNVKVAGSETATFTIDTPGTYQIFCEIHSDMAREIVIS